MFFSKKQNKTKNNPPKTPNQTKTKQKQKQKKKKKPGCVVISYKNDSFLMYELIGVFSLNDEYKITTMFVIRYTKR